MGNATSKAARKLPKRTEPPSWAGSAASRPAIPHTQRPIAREEKDHAIEQDSRDPQFMSNLSRLGAVSVDHHMQSVRPSNKSREMIESRMKSEQEVTSMQLSRNRLQAATLSYLLDTSKTASRQEMEELAEKYGIDIEKLENVSRSVASPSIKNDSVLRSVRTEDGEEEVSVMAIWVKSSALKA